MKALVRHRYGGPGDLRVEEVAQPPLEDDRTLVRVRAASLNRIDWHRLRGSPLVMRPLLGGVLRPKSVLLGVDFAGVVEAVGNDVTDLRPGDEVFGSRDGALAEYVCAKTVVRKPANVSFEEAACLPLAGLTALQAVREHGKVQPGERVLINGASGGVGTLSIQISKALGAEVTAVVSARNVELARALGADRVVDRGQEDFTRGAARYDLVLDVAGGHSWSSLRRVLAPGGRVVFVGAHGSPSPLLHIGALKLASLRRKRELIFYITRSNQPDLQFLAGLLEGGQLRPAIDRTYELGEAQDAFRTLGEGHVSGKLVLTI